jgi:hypothetical protein
MANRNMMDEILSGVEDVGDVDILGRPASAAAKAPRGNTYNPNAEYTKGFDIDVGFASAAFGGAAIAVGATATITVSVVRPFLPKEMRVPSSIAQDFEVVAINLADMSFIDGAPVSCAAYSEVSNARDVNFGTINPSVPLTMTVRNVGPAPARFVGSFRGTKVTL